MGTNIIVTWFLVGYAVAVTVQTDSRESRTVQTTQGPVRGYKSGDGDFYQFFGIPYATAPTGRRRFTAPLPGPVWMTPFEAVESDIVCPQKIVPLLNKQNLKIRENCLIVNVHVPTTEKSNLPVLVFVHGGGYVLGYGELFNTHNLARSKKFIVVTFNYRLGAQGFLCLGTQDAPGNAGMKDQVALLRWVQKNIGNFGGNPNDVTIAGASAGSSAVDLLMLSDMARGLFNKVIPESGASLSPWSIQVDPVEYARDFARLKNFSNAYDFFALEEYYKTASYEELASEGFFLRSDSSLHFTPCVERDVGQEMFLSEAPINILKQGKFEKVPVLNGFANMEGLLTIQYYEDRKNKMNERFADFLPADLQFSSGKEKEEVAKIVKEFYFGDKPVGEDTIQGYIDYFSDIMFAIGHLRTVKLQVEAGSDSIYLYEYSFYSPSPEASYPDFMKDIRGASHCAQTFAVYESEIGLSSFDDNSEAFKNMKAAIQEIWINFITIGQQKHREEPGQYWSTKQETIMGKFAWKVDQKPTELRVISLNRKPVPNGSNLPAWPPVGSNRSPYMDLGQEIKLKGPLLEKRVRFWDQIYEKYYRTPQPPTPPRVRNEL